MKWSTGIIIVLVAAVIILAVLYFVQRGRNIQADTLALPDDSAIQNTLADYDAEKKKAEKKRIEETLLFGGVNNIGRALGIKWSL